MVRGTYMYVVIHNGRKLYGSLFNRRKMMRTERKHKDAHHTAFSVALGATALSASSNNI